VGRASTMGLHIGKTGFKELTKTLFSQLFSLIHNFTATVIALARIPFGILVGQNTASSLKNSTGYEIFGGNQFDSLALAFLFCLKNFTDFQIHSYAPFL